MTSAPGRGASSGWLASHLGRFLALELVERVLVVDMRFENPADSPTYPLPIRLSQMVTQTVRPKLSQSHPTTVPVRT